VNDQPSGADRLVVRSTGVEYTWVNGVATRFAGEDVATATSPGRLLRAWGFRAWRRAAPPFGGEPPGRRRGFPGGVVAGERRAARRSGVGREPAGGDGVDRRSGLEQ